jgi:tetratricopeptide (TPR) repeat protein
MQTDPRFQIVTKTEMLRLAKDTTNIATQYTLLSQAFYSELLYELYQFYKTSWDKDKENPYLLFLAGLAGMECVTHAFYSSVHIELDQPNKCADIAHICFSKLRKKLNSDIKVKVSDKFVIQAEIGYWLWQYKGQRKEGLLLLKDADKKQPNNARIIYLLARIYGETSGDVYNLKLSMDLYQRLTSIVPDYAMPHYYLAVGYAQQNNGQQAQKHLDIYLKMLPEYLKNKEGGSAKERIKMMLNAVKKR